MLYCDDVEPEAIDDNCTETIGHYHMAGCARFTVGQNIKFLPDPIRVSMMRARNIRPRALFVRNPISQTWKTC
jgi:hypothetical protein